MNNIAKLHDVLNDAKDYCISFLQETKLQSDRISSIRSKWRNQEGIFMSCARQGSRRGVVTLFSENLEITHLASNADDDGQYMINVCEYHQRTMMFVNTYGSPDSDANAVATFQRLALAIEQMQANFHIDDIVMAGDFNVVLDPNDTTSTMNKPRAEARLRTLVFDIDVIDVDQILSASPEKTYFCKHSRGPNMEARYDRYYISQHLIEGAKLDRRPRPDDHTPLVLTILDQGPPDALWRFDDKLLMSAIFSEKVKEEIRQALSEFCIEDVTDVDINTVQNLVRSDEPFKVLAKVLEKVIRLSKKEMKEKRKKAKQKSEEALQKLIDAREVYNQAYPQTDADRERMEEAVQEYKNVQRKRADMAAVNNHKNYASHGEKLTQYYFSRMKAGRPSREIHKLVINEAGGPRSLEGEEIRRHMTEKYEDIARKDPQVGDLTIAEFLGEDLVQSSKEVPLDAEEMMCRDITSDELEGVVKELKNRSAPGPTGITNPLLKFLFPMIREILAAAGNKWLWWDEPKLPPAGLYHRKIIFILKQGKDRTSPDAYRGLSMLENIYKLYSKILANRMAPVLEQIQDKMQFGFTRNTGCMEASRTIIDAIYEAAQTNTPLININTDVYKAFDMIDKQHIFNCMEFYSFPEKFIEAYKRLSQNATAEFEVNRKRSEQINLERGTGQGDPSSSFLFNLAVTPLNHFLSNSPVVPRISFGNVEVPPVSFADDNDLPLDGNELQKIKDTIRKITEYERVSGLKLNMNKCEVMAVNCDQVTVDNLLQETGMKRVHKTKHLGLVIDESGNLTKEDNMQPIHEKLKRIVKTYSTSMSTPIGRSLYAKYLMSSRYIHVTMNRSIAKNEAKKIKKQLVKMTWTKYKGPEAPGTRPHIAKDRIAQNIRFGGLGVPEPEIQSKSLKLAWVRKIHQGSQEQVWYARLAQWLQDEQCPTPEQHLKLGSIAWKTTADKLRQKSKYWAETFDHIAEIIEAAHRAYKQWHLIPIIGSSRIADDNLGALTFSNPHARRLIANGLCNIGQLFRTNEAGHVTATNMKSMAELQAEYDPNLSFIMMHSLANLARDTKRKFRQAIQQGTVMPTNTTAIEELLKKYPSGCSAATEVLLAKKRQGWEWGDCPRSYSTYRDDGFTDITQKQFSAAFVKVRKTLAMPAAQWTSTQVLTCTLWTAKKEATTRRGIAAGETGDCKNCLEDEEESVAHAMYHCTVMQELLEWVYRAINEVRGNNAPGHPLVPNVYQVLFHKLSSDISFSHRNTIDDLLILAKHQLYQLRMRDDSQRRPTRRRVAGQYIGELRRHIEVLEHNGKTTQFIKEIEQRLSEIARWPQDG